MFLFSNSYNNNYYALVFCLEYYHCLSSLPSIRCASLTQSSTENCTWAWEGGGGKLPFFCKSGLHQLNLRSSLEVGNKHIYSCLYTYGVGEGGGTGDKTNSRWRGGHSQGPYNLFYASHCLGCRSKFLTVTIATWLCCKRALDCLLHFIN